MFNERSALWNISLTSNDPKLSAEHQKQTLGLEFTPQSRNTKQKSELNKKKRSKMLKKYSKMAQTFSKINGLNTGGEKDSTSYLVTLLLQ